MRRIAVVLIAIFGLAVLAGCEEPKDSTAKQDTRATEENQKRANATVGWPDVSQYAEKAQLKKYYEEVDDPNRTGYVYLLNYGKIMAEYTVKGKVSSLNSSFTAPERYYDCGADCGTTIPLAEPDGSYGEYPDGIFFWTTDGVLIEWSGDYQYSTQRLELAEPPQISLVKNVP